MFNLIKQIFSTERSPLGALRSQVAQIGHPQYPFLHREYSPNSRIPCADFTRFIVGRLESNDVLSVTHLMHEILRSNPGLGTDASWIDQKINGFLSIDFSKFIRFENSKAYYELVAMWIIAAKDGADKEFWISPDSMFPTFFAWALSPYQINVQTGISRLVDAANRWIRKMQKEAPFWLNCALLDKKDLKNELVESCVSRNKFLDLSVGARLHLCTAIKFGLGSLPALTDYKLRSFGLDISASVQEILQSELLILAHDVESLSKALSKDELLQASSHLDIEIKKSWNKSKLLAEIASFHPELINQLMNSKVVVKINPQFETELTSLINRSQKFETIFRALCFAS